MIKTINYLLWLLSFIFQPTIVFSQFQVNAPSFKTYILVDNMETKAQFFKVEQGFKSVPGFQKLDCKDFPPDYLILYTSAPADKGRITDVFKQAEIKIFEICDNEIDLERAIYRRQVLSKPTN